MVKAKERKIQLLQWNCRSLMTNLAYLKHYLTTTACDVLILQSPNVSSKKLPKIPNFDYPPVCDKPKGKVYTAIYILKGLDYSPLELSTLKDLTDIYVSGVTITFNKSLILNTLSVYLPKGPNDQNTEWLRTIQDFQRGKWIIAGDFNAHAPFWESNCQSVTSNRLVENIVDSSLFLLNNGSFTRIPDVSRHRPTAIDLSLISPELAPSCSWETHDNTLGSDHVPIKITIYGEVNNPDKYIPDKIPKFCYKRADWNMFQQILACRDYDRIESDDVNTLYSEFKATVLSAANSSIPRLNSIKTYNHRGNIWWTELCNKAVQHKKDRFKMYIRDRSIENHLEMKKANEHSNRTIEAEKKSYWTSFCSKEVSYHKDFQKVWKKIKEMKNGIRLPTCPITIDKNDFPSNTEKAEAFADMFAKNSRCEGLSPYDKQYRELQSSKPIYSDPLPQNNMWFNSPITLEEVKIAIASLSNKKCSVGPDAVSNEMLKKLPENCVHFLHKIFLKCWNTGTLPQSWKKSIVVPVLKSGKSKFDKVNYRPIALTSHTSKLMEKIILCRMTDFCEKYKVIPINQAGFRKGRSTTELLIKLSTQIKCQFARRQSVLATFFDVRKAYDQVWHKRLLYKLKSIGLCGNLYNYIKSFLTNRTMETKVGSCYSFPRNLEMGIPQGSVIAPLLFNILVQDLPKALSKNVVLVQYADDICIWMNTNMKKSTPQRTINYQKRLYQSDLSSLEKYMTENGLTLSTEKTNMMLFNPGSAPNNLPTFKLNGEIIEYTQVAKFLGVNFTTKLTWNFHIQHILTKARKGLNVLKIISRHPWGMDTECLLHLATALIRSKLSYAQEVFFSAPKYLLKKLESIDCKAIKLALGVPVHASNQKAYKEAGMLPLAEHREIAAAKFIIRTNSVENFVSKEIEMKSDSDFPKRAHTISSQKTIATFTSALFKESKINPKDVAIKPSFSPVPKWELLKAFYDINYVDMKKDENTNILTSTVRTHIDDHYKESLQVFTDGSVLDTKNVGAAFVIPVLKVTKSYFLGKTVSIFSAELVAILKALDYLLDFPQIIFKAVIFVDSKSVLNALNGFNLDTRPDLIIEISHMIHYLKLKGTDITFCWVPSHCGLYWNERADVSAKRGAQRANNSIPLSISPSVKELCNSLKSTAWIRLCGDGDNPSLPLKEKRFPVSILKQKLSHSSIYYSRRVTSVIFCIRLNALRTKYCKNVLCPCGKHLSLDHVLFDCQFMLQFLPSGFKDCSGSTMTFDEIKNNPLLLSELAQSLVHSPISRLL